MSSVTLLNLDERPVNINWGLGPTKFSSPTLDALTENLGQIASSKTSDAVLLWDPRCGLPDAVVVQQILERPGDLWHAGLRLGMDGRPGLLDFVAPTWMLNRDPDSNIEATSWRLSLRACMIRCEVLRQMGGPNAHFHTLAGAALEMGHRYVQRGVFTRSAPELISADMLQKDETLPFEDELRFMYYRFGSFWACWALGRAVLSRYVSLLVATRSWQNIVKETLPSQPTPYQRPQAMQTQNAEGKRVSVVIPTLDRYPYLQTVLGQVEKQSIAPVQVIVIDQTSQDTRDTTLTKKYPNLPLNVLVLEESGQCSSRNLGLQHTTGEYVLFIDDDDEIESDLIERHLHHLQQTGAEVSSGVAHEVGTGPLPEDFTFARVSSVFPTNNTLIRKKVLDRSGLFDLAYNHQQRADGDLGMRIYLSGALMALNSEIGVLHHHAPRGGLRAHNARVITYASSRERLTHRHLPSVSEIYLARRYFSPRQTREMIWLRLFGTMRGKGGRSKQVAKFVVGFLLLPDSLVRVWRRYRQASDMFQQFPQIPCLSADMPDNV